MSICPACQRSTALKITAITSDTIWYYGCSACEHVWTMKKVPLATSAVVAPTDTSR
jgi:hypothetical protein